MAKNRVSAAVEIFEEPGAWSEANLMSDCTTMSDASILNREMYSEPEAARLVRVAPSTLHYWLEGGSQRGKVYRPIIRSEPRGDRSVTWAEFVEAALLRECRREHKVPMAELRQFIDGLRGRLGVPYPLADKRPYTSARQLVEDAQEEAGLDAPFCLVAVAGQQRILTPASQSFLDRVTWDGDTAVGWRPHDDSESPVLVSPTLRFGRPAVKGVSTEVIWEHSVLGDEGVGEIAEAFGIDAEDVRWALAYETSVHAAAA